MPDTITKILFRRGLDIVRRTGGGDGVKLNVGEPGYNIDTKRLYMGDGIDGLGTIGGTPVGIKMHGILPSIVDVGGGINSNAAPILSANGIDVGDMLFESGTSIMYYVSSKTPNATLPNSDELPRISLIGSVSSYNGISSSKNNVSSGIYVTNWLDPLYFTVGGSLVLINQNTQIGSTGPGARNLVVWGDITTNNHLVVANDAHLQNNLTVDQNVVVGGEIFVFPYTRGYTSNDWYSGYTSWSNLSGALSATTAFIDSLLPFPWNYDHTSKIISTDELNNARVGINTTPNFVGLAVKGVDTLTTALSVYGSILTTGDVVVYTTSDMALKKNIEIIPDALSKVCSLKGITFDWNCSHRSGRDAGVVAQDVEKVLPEIVCKRDDGSKAVHYEGLIPLLVEAVKELNSKIK